MKENDIKIKRYNHIPTNLHTLSCNMFECLIKVNKIKQNRYK